MYNLFLSAVSQFGLPSRVRSDQGRENYSIAIHMLESRGVERNSMITGSSVHNQRIERFWRDLYRCVIAVFYRLFYFLEHHGYLDPTNNRHRYALHYVYLPRINQSISIFKDAWNHHGIRTEHNRSPHQLFVRGALQLRMRGLNALDFFEQVDSMYGAEDGTLEQGDNDYTVHVPQITFQLTEHQLRALRSLVNPVEETNDFGVNLYLRTCQFLDS